MSNEQNLGEQALDKIAELAISSQVDQAEQVNVDIQTDPIKLAQGKLDSVAVTGEGMVIKQDLRVEAISISTDSVAINPLKAVLGELELTRSTNAQVQVLLTEADLNRALSSDYLRGKITALEIQAQDRPITVEIQQIQLHLPTSEEMVFDVELLVPDTAEVKHILATVRPFLKNAGYCIGLEILSAEGQGLCLDFVTALLEKIAELLDLRNFDLNGSTLQLQDFDVQVGQVLIRGKGTIEQTLL